MFAEVSAADALEAGTKAPPAVKAWRANEIDNR
jgi:hypothetical protein